MTQDIRSVLEEAFKVIHCVNEAAVYRELWTRFRRFLDAEAWTDAAMMLVPEGCGIKILTGSNELPQFIAHSEIPTMVRVFFLSKGIDANGIADHPALALTTACLKAKEQIDG